MRKDKLPYQIVFFGLIGIIAMLVLINFTANHQANVKNAIIVRDTVTIVVKDTLPSYDSMKMAELVPVLHKREGLRLVPYPEVHINKKTKEKDTIQWLIGYGHSIGKDSLPIRITPHQADSILWDDIMSRYWIRRAVESKEYYWEVYELFTKGHL